jgi:hypothetical protein
MGPGSRNDWCRRVDCQRDAIRHVQVGIAARLLNGAHQVAGDTLRLELRRHGRIERDDARAARHLHGGADVIARDEARVELARLQLEVPGP